MKKLLALLLVFSMVFCFAACGKSDTIVVGYTIYEPMNYKDANGELVGFDTELAKKVFENLGYKNVVFKEIEWSDKYTELEAGSIDCIWNGFTANVADEDDGIQRSVKVDFSYNNMENLQVGVVKKGSGIASAADLKGKFGCAESGSAGETYANGFEAAEIKGLPKQTDCLTEVNGKSRDFAVLDAQLAKAYVGKGDYANLEIVEGLSSDVEYNAIVFKKGSDLTAKVNEQLEALAADGTLKTLAEKYGVGNSVVTDFSNQK